MGILDKCKKIDARKFSKSAKMTIQRTGKLGFSNEAADLFLLKNRQEKRLLLFDMGEDNFMAIVTNKENEEGFKILKGGEYYYVRMKNFFDSRSIPYQTKRVIYDISDTGEEYEGEKVYKLTQRIREYKKGEADDEEKKFKQEEVIFK